MVKILSVSTKFTSGAHNFTKTLTQFNFDYSLLARGQTWQGWRFRMKAYMDACLAEPPESILIFSDSDDVLCMKGGESELVEKYLAFGRDLVVSAESACVATSCNSIDAYWQHREPSVQTLMRYVNCGGIIGRARALATMWKWMLDEGYTDDQRALGHYVGRFYDTCAVDWQSHIFYVVPIPVRGLNPELHFKDDQSLDYLEDKLDHKRASPFFLHFAGNFAGPVVASAFLLQKRDLWYDQVAKTLLGSEAASYQSTNEDGRLVSVALFWGIFLFLLAALFTLTVMYVRIRTRKNVIIIKEQKST